VNCQILNNTPPGLQHGAPPGEDYANREELPFRIRIVRTEEHLAKAIAVRADAYSRHWPNLHSQLRVAEDKDREPTSLVLLAESKTSSEPLGTMRIDTNLRNDFDLGPETTLPRHINQSTAAYVTRLGVKQGSGGTLVKLALFKSLHRYCIAKQLAWIIVGVRPPNDRDYVRLGFSDLFANDALVPIPSSGGTPVRLMSLEVITAERRWKESGNPLYQFMFMTYHPDIEIFASVNGIWHQARRGTSFSNACDNFNGSYIEMLGIPVI
jgi:hypothetical protein